MFFKNVFWKIKQSLKLNFSYKFCLPLLFLRSPLKCQIIEEIDNEDHLTDNVLFQKKYYVSPTKNKDFIIFAGNASKDIGKEVATHLNTILGKISIIKSNIGESQITIHEDVNNKDVILIQSISPPTNDNLLELLFTISALKRESAKRIIVVIPYMGYSKQTLAYENHTRIPQSAATIIRLIEAMGAHTIISLEMHTNQVTGFARECPVIDLSLMQYGATYILEKIRKGKISSNPVVISPDLNGVTRAKKFCDILLRNGIDATLSFTAEGRYDSLDQTIELFGKGSKQLIGAELAGKDVIIVDNNAFGGVKLIETVNLVKKLNCDRVYAFIPHNMFNQDALKKIENSSLSEVITTNTIYSPFISGKITTISISLLLSLYIEELLNNLSQKVPSYQI